MGLRSGIEPGQVVRDRRVVRGGVRERLLREREPRRGAQRAAVRFHLGDDRVVVGRIGHHRDARVVLRRGAHHRRPADVDVLDRLLERAAGARDRLAERVEVDDDEVDRLGARLLDRRHVLRQVAPREQSAVDLRVQRLQPPVEHLRVAGVVGDLGDLHPARGEELRGAAGRQDGDAEQRERAREVGEAGLVRDAGERLPDADVHLRQEGGREKGEGKRAARRDPSPFSLPRR